MAKMNLGRVIVQERVGDGDNDWFDVETGEDFEGSFAKAYAWIKAKGSKDAKYRPARVGDEVTVEVVPVESRRLV